MSFVNWSNRFLFTETAKLDEVDLAFAISSTATGAERTFQRMKDTVQQIMQEYKTDKLRYAVLVFGDQTKSPLSFGRVLPDDKTVGYAIEWFSIECRETKTKAVIALTNHNICSPSSEPIRTGMQ